MWRNDRPTIDAFEDTERLYYRFSPGHIKNDSFFPPVIPLKFPDASVNRASLSRPVDVLVPDPESTSDFYAGYRVAWITKAHLPTDVREPSGEPVEMIPTHDPRDFNFAHTEVRTWIAGEFRRERQPQKPTRMRIREHIWRAVIQVVPNEELDDPTDDGTMV